jgi:hypothetical protein
MDSDDRTAFLANRGLGSGWTGLAHGVVEDLTGTVAA